MVDITETKMKKKKSPRKAKKNNEASLNPTNIKPKTKMKSKHKPKRYFETNDTENKKSQTQKFKVKTKLKGTFKRTKTSSQQITTLEGKDQLQKRPLFVKSKRQERMQKWESKHKKLGKKRSGDLSEMRKPQDPFPGNKPVPRAALQKYERGDKMKDKDARTIFASKILKKQEKKLKTAATQSARTEFLMQEEPGYLEGDETEETSTITQHDIANVVDINSAAKFFELKLNDFGPYRLNYTRNGRFLLIGGAKGHVAAIDWMTKKLLCEVNVMETLHDVSWLHQETMYAVAQKQWTYIYDNQGIELHCLKVLDQTLKMEFLPYHFLLAAANAKGYLSYIDVSVGEKVAGYGTQMGRLDVMCQNRSNAVVALGHTSGTVTMWCPKVKEPIAKMLCHISGVRSIAIDKAGLYMASSGIDRTVKIWDLRTYKMLQSYKVSAGAGQLAFSQTGCLSAGIGNVVEVYKDCCRQTVLSPYLVHNLTSPVRGLEFCPYEDVLGVGHGNGFSSLIIPGAGEANFDALEDNPYQNKKQRRQAEVKMLLEKIPADMIHLSTGIIGQVDKLTLQQKMEENNKILHNKPLKLDFEPRYKKKGRSKGARVIQRKKGVIQSHNREHIKKALVLKQKQNRKKLQSSNRHTTVHQPGGVLDRFKRKGET